MDAPLIGVLMLAAMFVLIAVHVPIGVAMALSGFVGIGILIGWDPAIALFSIEPAQAIASEELAVIAMFLLMGNFASAAGLSADLFKLAQAFVGHRKGGLAVATIAGCAGFGAVCGSSVATVGTMARIALPEMQSRGYAAHLATGSIASGATLGIIVPPSVILVLYAVLTEQFITALFVAAVVPAIIATLGYIVAVLIYVRFNPESGPAGPKLAWAARRQALKDSWGVLALAGIVSGGIYTGLFTVNEAAAVGAAVAVLFCWLRGKLTRASFFANLKETAASTALIYLIIIGANTFTYFITLSHLPDILTTSIIGSGLSPEMILFLLLVMYIILGSIFDTIAAMVITLPFVFPLIISLGYDPIWWGVINVIVVELGMITPPFGMNCFVMQGMARNVSLGTVYRGVMPFVYADVARLFLLAYVPFLTLWLPKAVGVM